MLDNRLVDHDTADAAVRETDWKELHRRLRSLAQQRVALEAEEASYLVEAEESHLYKRLGYSTMVEYMERELHYGPHAANERLRVARDLVDLPLIAEQFRAGELCFSAVRELTRVATPNTEEGFLAKAHNKTARDVERMVSGLRRGDAPDAEPDLALIKQRVVLEVSIEVAERFRRTRTALDNERGERLNDNDVLERGRDRRRSPASRANRGDHVQGVQAELRRWGRADRDRSSDGLTALV